MCSNWRVVCDPFTVVSSEQSPYVVLVVSSHRHGPRRPTAFRRDAFRAILHPQVVAGSAGGGGARALRRVVRAIGGAPARPPPHAPCPRAARSDRESVV